jgi:hypothetical protein
MANFRGQVIRQLRQKKYESHKITHTILRIIKPRRRTTFSVSFTHFTRVTTQAIFILCIFDAKRVPEFAKYLPKQTRIFVSKITFKKATKSSVSILATYLWRQVCEWYQNVRIGGVRGWQLVASRRRQMIFL